MDFFYTDNIHFRFEFVHLRRHFKLSDMGKTVPRFHTDYIISNIRFRFEFVHLKVDTSSFICVKDCIPSFSFIRIT